MNSAGRQRLYELKECGTGRDKQGSASLCEGWPVIALSRPGESHLPTGHILQLGGCHVSFVTATNHQPTDTQSGWKSESQTQTWPHWPELLPLSLLISSHLSLSLPLTSD